MQAYLLLIGAGTFWVGGIVGACIWWNVRRAGRSRAANAEVGRAHSEDLGGRPTPESKVAVALPEGLAMDPLQQVLRRLPSSPEVWPGDAASSASRASSLRFSYRQRQWAACCPKGRLPEPDDFATVECHELFGDGVSFFSDSMCSTETIVVTLGTHDRMVFMLARVMSEVSQPGGSPAAYLVNCRFIRRVRENTVRWARALRSMQAAPAPQAASGGG
jgi:hypothetical protein